MRLLITGGLGLIGAEIAGQAIAAGHDVTIVDDGRASVVSTVEGARHVTIALERFWSAEPFDAVVHCAAPVGPVGILGRRVLHETILGTEAAIEIARERDARLVVMSSSEVYGTTAPGGSLVVPDDWSHRTEYAVGKIVTEQLARRHRAETGLPTAVVRPWNVTGPRQDAAKGFVFPRMAAQAVAGEPLTVYAPGDQRRAFMAVEDFADRIVALLEDDPAAPRWSAAPLDAATPANAVSMIELAEMFVAHHLSRAQRAVKVDPQLEHGTSFREAAAGSKLPPERVALPGRTPLADMVDLAMVAAAARAPVRAAA